MSCRRRLRQERWALPPNYFEGMDVALRKQAENTVDSAIGKLKTKLNNTVSLDGQIVPGPPRTVILDEAESWAADLIVVGSISGVSCEVFTGSSSLATC